MESRYHEVYERWLRDPEGFCIRDRMVADVEQGVRRGKGVHGRWFVGAECYTAHNCLDKLVEGGRADQPALIQDSPQMAHRRDGGLAARELDARIDDVQTTDVLDEITVVLKARGLAGAA